MRLFYGPYAGAGKPLAIQERRVRRSLRQEPPRGRHSERNKLYEAMTRIISAQAPRYTNAYRISSTVVAPQIRGYRKNVHYFLTPWEYLDIDAAVLRAQRQ